MSDLFAWDLGNARRSKPARERTEYGTEGVVYHHHMIQTGLNYDALIRQKKGGTRAEEQERL